MVKYDPPWLPSTGCCLPAATISSHKCPMDEISGVVNVLMVKKQIIMVMTKVWK